MGNDGGTIAKRSDIVNASKPVETEVEQYDDVSTIYVTCKLSQKTLVDQAVLSDYQGNLFLRQSILEFLVNKEYKKNPEFSHIRSLQDLVVLNPLFKHYRLICRVERDTADTFSYLRLCGCVMNRKLVEGSINQNLDECPSCGKSFNQDDIVILNPLKNKSFEDLNTITYKNLKNQGLSHSKKKRKRKANSKVSKTS